MGMDKEPLAFLSFSREDASTYAESITKRLRESGFQIACDPQLLQGDDYQRMIEEIVAADVVIILLSKASNRSAWVQSEIALALRGNSHIFPVLLDDTGTQSALMSLVGDRQFINAVDCPPDDVADRILNSLDLVARATIVSNKYRVQASAPKVSNQGKHLITAVVIAALTVMAAAWLSWSKPSKDSIPIEDSEEFRLLILELETQRLESQKLLEEAREREEQLREAQRLLFDGVQSAGRGQLTQAINLYKRSKDIDPTNATTLQLLGYAHFRRSQLNPTANPEDPSIALEYLERAVELDPAYTWARYNLSLVQWHVGETSEALEGIQKLFEIDPEFLTIIQEDLQFNSIIASDEFENQFEFQ